MGGFTPPIFFLIGVYIMNDAIKKYLPWSISKLTVSDACGLKFKWQYIDKKKEKRSEDGRARIGSAAHKVVELLLKNKANYKRAIKIASIDNKLTNPEIESLMEYGHNIKEFLARIDKFSEKHPIKELLVEQRFAFTPSLKPTKFFDNKSLFRGVFDLVLLLEEGTAIIIDHKTGQPGPISKHSAQLNLYSLAAFILYPEITGVQCAIHYIKDSTISWGKYISKDSMDDLKNWLNTYLHDKTENIATEEFTPNKSWLCNFCGFKADCPIWSVANGEKGKAFE